MKQFLVILFLTALVWVGVSMSEENEYPLRVRVEMKGYDTLRYAVLQADTSVTLNITTSGYNAFLFYITKFAPTMEVAVDNSSHSAATEILCNKLMEDYPGIQKATSYKDSLRITLVERQHRSYHPKLKNVAFSFAEQYGLYGQPQIIPEEVTLYGPEEVLNKIDELCVANAKVTDIKSSHRYRLPLEPIWEQYGDVHPSCKDVSVYIPVEAYVEQNYRIPIKVINADTNVNLRLYPEVVTVRMWVAKRFIEHETNLNVTIDYHDVLTHEQPLTPQITEFPAYMRPRSIEPSTVQCVIIK